MNNLRRTNSDSNIKKHRKLIIRDKQTKKTANNKLTKINIENNLHEVNFGDYNLLNIGDIIYWHTLKTGKLAGAMIVNIKETKKGRRYFKVKLLDKSSAAFTLYWDRIDKIYIKRTLNVEKLWREIKLLKIKINTLLKILSAKVNKNITAEYNKKITSMTKEISKIDKKNDELIKKKYIKKFQNK